MLLTGGVLALASTLGVIRFRGLHVHVIIDAVTSVVIALVCL
jgi:hypothetical protein